MSWRTNRRTQQPFIRLELENALVLGNKERIGIWDTGFTTKSRQPGKFYEIQKGGERIGHIDLLHYSYEVDQLISDYDEKTDILLDNIEVDEPGHGYGSQAYELVEQELHNRGVERIFIFPVPDAEGFWENQGYTEVKKREDTNYIYYRDMVPLPLWVKQL